MRKPMAQLRWITARATGLSKARAVLRRMSSNTAVNARAPMYAAWNSFRNSEDSRYVGLTGPRFLLRRIYGKD